MNYSKLPQLYLFFTFLFNAHYVCATQFDLGALKKNPVTAKKVDTVIVTKRGSSNGSLLNSIKNAIGFSFVFERIIPRLWKKVLGFRRASFISFLTTTTALINLGLMGYFVFYHYPFIFKNRSLFGFNANLPKPVQVVPLANQGVTTVQKPILPVVAVPVAPEEVKPVATSQKPLGEFE